jgi:sulfonate transport system permease protein
MRALKFILRYFSDIRGLVIPVLILLIWDWMAKQDASHAYAFATFSQIYSGLSELLKSGELQNNLYASIGRALTGLLIGASLGFLTGTLMSFSRIANILIAPLYHTIRQVPLMGLVPVFALWYGNGDTSKLIVVSLSSFYPVVLATYESMQQVEKNYREVGQVLKLSEWKVFQKIVLPAALPQIFTGISFALAFAWLSTIGSEMLFSAGSGLGNLMMNAQEASRMDILIIVTIVIGVMGYSMTLSIQKLGLYLFRWRR